MPKKKAVASGFGLFMKELQEKYAREGRRIRLSEMKDIADPFWKKMTEEQRKKYTVNAKMSRRAQSEKLASDGTSIKHNQELLEEEELRERQMILDVREHVNGNEQDPEVFRKLALGQTFYIISFNILCCTDEEEYYPLEVGIAEYSILKGVLRRYHKFIFPGRVPTGYMGEAKRHSEETHQIPFTGHESSEKDYLKIMNEIEKFICPLGTEDEAPPLFTPHNAIEQTTGCIMWLVSRSGYRFRRENVYGFPRVWDLRFLLMELRFGVAQALPSVFIAEEILSKNTFDYTCGTSCEFHEELDCKDCALGLVVRLCYLLSDCLCGVFDVEVTDKHLPVRSLEAKPYEILQAGFPNSRYLPPKPKHTQEEEPKNLPMVAKPPQPPNLKTSSSSGFNDFEGSDSDPDLSLDYRPGPHSLKPQVPATAFAQLSLSNKTAPGLGIGRGRPCNK